MFTRVFEPFENSRQETSCTLPNVARYQLRHTPMCEKYSIFRSFSVSGQTCGQTAFYSNFGREHSAEKTNVYKGFQRFSGFHNEGAVSCSQTRRDTKLRHASMREKYGVFQFWSKLWSKLFLRENEATRTRLFAVFLAFSRFFEGGGSERPLAPKRRALPTAPHPDGGFYLILTSAMEAAY